MRRLTILFLILPLLTYAQELNWFELGTMWTYQYTNPLAPEEGTQEISLQVEEIVEYNGQLASKVDVVAGNTNPFGCTILQPPFYFYESNDSVFYSTDDLSAYYLAYVVSNEVSQSWTYTLVDPVWEINGDFGVSVSSTEQISVDGYDLIQTELNYTPISFEMFTVIYPESRAFLEGVGGIDHFIVPLGHLSVCDPWLTLDFVCFNSPSFDYQSPDYESCVLSTSESVARDEGGLYPNPATTWVRVKGNPDRIRVLDGKGATLISMNEINEPIIDVRNLASGFYIVQSEHNGVLRIERLIIH